MKYLGIYGPSTTINSKRLKKTKHPQNDDLIAVSCWKWRWWSSSGNELKLTIVQETCSFLLCVGCYQPKASLRQLWAIRVRYYQVWLQTKCVYSKSANWIFRSDLYVLLLWVWIMHKLSTFIRNPRPRLKEGFQIEEADILLLNMICTPSDIYESRDLSFVAWPRRDILTLLRREKVD